MKLRKKVDEVKVKQVECEVWEGASGLVAVGGRRRSTSAHATTVTTTTTTATTTTTTTTTITTIATVMMKTMMGEGEDEEWTWFERKREGERKGEWVCGGAVAANVKLRWAL